MEPIWIIRIFLVLFLTLSGYGLGAQGGSGSGLEFSAFGFLLALFIIGVEYSSKVMDSKKLVLACTGAFLGLLFAFLFRDTFPETVLTQEASNSVFNLLFMYFGIVIALRNADRISLSRLRLFVTNPREDSIILDTSVIIDGRIVELYNLGFMAKEVIVPTFVINELQTLSDSADSAKRHTGRKGLENLEDFKDILKYQILEKDFVEETGVDHKLIALAKEIGSAICTNDYNLSKVATIHQVKSLNINTLSAALRPSLSVGDQLVISLTREGKDANQGVGYLEDGTMVVVDDGKELIGEMVPVSIVGMMQTNAGRLAFARLIGDEEKPDEAKARDSQTAIGMLNKSSDHSTKEDADSDPPKKKIASL